MSMLRVDVRSNPIGRHGSYPHVPCPPRILARAVFAKVLRRVSNFFFFLPFRSFPGFVRKSAGFHAIFA